MRILKRTSSLEFKWLKDLLSKRKKKNRKKPQGPIPQKQNRRNQPKNLLKVKKVVRKANKKKRRKKKDKDYQKSKDRRNQRKKELLESKQSSTLEEQWNNSVENSGNLIMMKANLVNIILGQFHFISKLLKRLMLTEKFFILS